MEGNQNDSDEIEVGIEHENPDESPSQMDERNFIGNPEGDFGGRAGKQFRKFV